MPEQGRRRQPEQKSATNADLEAVSRFAEWNEFCASAAGSPGDLPAVNTMVSAGRV
jgi:hypothetical protein